MTDRKAMLDLAAKVEAASGTDRELDAEIALAVGVVTERDGDLFFGHRDHSVMVMERGYYDIEGSAPELPRFTASLDAAMTLIPVGDGVGWRMTDGAGGPTAEIWSLDLDNGAMTLWEVGAMPTATPALAICAAALKARAQ